MAVQIGDPAPDLLSFGALSQPRKLPDLRGRWVVLFFFPRGNHPHCVMESRRFQLLALDFERLNVQLIGVSVDTAEEQKQFSSFCMLSFPLISDARHQISAAFGVLDSAVVDGEQIIYARRETFLIGPDGRVSHHWTGVDPHTHAAEVLMFMQNELSMSTLGRERR